MREGGRGKEGEGRRVREGRRGKEGEGRRVKLQREREGCLY